MRNRVWTEEQIEFIKNNAKGNPPHKMMELCNTKFGINRTRKQYEYLYHNRGIKTGIDCKFKKGQTSFNKGKKWNEYMSKEGQANSRKTWFKKGQPSITTKPVGSRYIRKDGYVWVKIAEHKWIEEHKLVWYQYHKEKLPPYQKILHIDGNKQNNKIDNLILISNAESLYMNNKMKLTENSELNKAIIYTTKLKLGGANGR